MSSDCSHKNPQTYTKKIIFYQIFFSCYHCFIDLKRQSEPSGLRRATSSETNLDEILATPEDSDIGFILEVALEYPQELHESHRDYPLAPIIPN